MSKKYTNSMGAKVNSNCDVEFNTRPNGKVDIRITVFEDETVNVSEETFKTIVNLLEEYKGVTEVATSPS